MSKGATRDLTLALEVDVHCFWMDLGYLLEVFVRIISDLFVLGDVGNPGLLRSWFFIGS